MARRRPSRKGLVTCPSCGCEADPSTGAVNFCPDCGADLRSPPPDASRSGGFVHRVIADRYRLVDLVGEGGMGAVYRAEHIRMGKALALKILRGDFAEQPDAAARFLSEARIVSRLSHPHTIAVFDFGEIEGGGFYLAMEYVPGQDLATILKTSGPLPERRAAEIGQQILGSLAEAHDAGIVHRDVKPGNVMLMKTRSDEDFVKVLDFGIAKLRQAPDTAATAGGAPLASTTTTSAGAIVGTPSYIAPEQARGDPIDARTDLYAVGCLLYELVSGKPPFVAPTPMAVVAAHLHDEPLPLHAVVPGVSRAFSDAIHKALRKRPDDRYPTADAMREALADASEPTQSRALARPDVVGGTGIASREDFAELDRHVRALRRGRVVGPITVLAVALAGGLLAWRWQDAYGLLVAHAPAVARALPAALRPATVFDGEEREPNDDPLRANRLPLPPGPDGKPGGGVAEVRGSVGARLNETTGDADLFRIDVPPTDRRKVLVAEWHGERSAGEGIRGLDVMLALNRARPPGDARPAPLVATTNRGGAGKPERLAAAVEPGTYYLSVREVHDEPTGPVEKPTDRYLLSVRLVDPTPGEEVEPNDGPDRSVSGPERYAEWRAAAERNPLGEGAPIRAATALDDPDLFAVAPRADGEAPELVVAVPAADLALEARLWIPDAEDLVRAGAGDRVRFDDGGSAPLGEPLLVPIRPRPRADAPALLELRASEGEGPYVVVALGPAPASQLAVVRLAQELVAGGRGAQAAALAKVYALAFPDAPGLADVLAAGVVVEPGGVASVPGAEAEAAASTAAAAALVTGAASTAAAGLGLSIGPGPDAAVATTAK